MQRFAGVLLDGDGTLVDSNDAQLWIRALAVALRCGGWGDADLRGSARVSDEPADLLARFDRSPFASAGIQP